jgi:hypothetical protein
MKCVPSSQANFWLRAIGMRLDDWNRIVSVASDCKPNSVGYQPPRDALKLFCFSRHALEWVPKGNSWLLQLDNSTTFDPSSASLFSTLLTDGRGKVDLVENRTFLFEFGAGNDRAGRVELQVSNLVFALLLLECHAYLVSSNSTEGQMLSVQDGFAYLETREQNELKARLLIANYERNPIGYPNWVNEIIGRHQASDQ